MLSPLWQKTNFLDSFFFSGLLILQDPFFLFSPALLPFCSMALFQLHWFLIQKTSISIIFLCVKGRANEHRNVKRNFFKVIVDHATSFLCSGAPQSMQVPLSQIIITKMYVEQLGRLEATGKRRCCPH